MRESVCIFLQCEDGEETVAGETPKRATAVCLANGESDCQKGRAKLRISPWCWRIKKPRAKKGRE